VIVIKFFHGNRNGTYWVFHDPTGSDTSTKFYLICKTNTSCKLEYLNQSCILLYFISIINDVIMGEITFDLYHISFMIVSRV
jgi:hypothetical protein